MRPLGTEAVVPPGLEARVRRSVRRRHYGLLAAAAVLLVMIGGAAGRLSTPRPARDLRPRFLLLLYENERFNPAGVPHDSLVREYSAWTASLADQQVLVTAAELAPDERLMSGNGIATRGPAGLIDGFFVVRAENLAAAEVLAATSPHLKYGGEVAVRPFAGN